MPGMDLANPVTRREASATLPCVGDQQLKIQTLGPGSEILFMEGPTAGKKWEVRLSIIIKEDDI